MREVDGTLRACDGVHGLWVLAFLDGGPGLNAAGTVCEVVHGFGCWRGLAPLFPSEDKELRCGVRRVTWRQGLAGVLSGVWPCGQVSFLYGEACTQGRQSYASYPGQRRCNAGTHPKSPRVRQSALCGWGKPPDQQHA